MRIRLLYILLLASFLLGSTRLNAETGKGLSQQEITTWVELWSVILGRSLNPQEITQLTKALNADLEIVDPPLEALVKYGAAAILLEYYSAEEEVQQAMRSAMQAVFREMARRNWKTPVGALSSLLLPKDVPAVRGSEFFRIPSIGSRSFTSLKDYLLFCASLLNPEFTGLDETGQAAFERNLINTFAVSSPEVWDSYRSFDVEYSFAYLWYICASKEQGQERLPPFLGLYLAMQKGAQLDMLPQVPAELAQKSDIALWQGVRQAVLELPHSFSAVTVVSCKEMVEDKTE